MRDLGVEKLRRVQHGRTDDHGHALCLHALHDALDVAHAKFVAFRFPRQTLNAHDPLLLAGARTVPNNLKRRVGHEVFASEVDLHDGPYSTIKLFYATYSNIRLKLALIYIAHSFFSKLVPSQPQAFPISSHCYLMQKHDNPLRSTVYHRTKGPHEPLA